MVRNIGAQRRYRRQRTLATCPKADTQRSGDGFEHQQKQHHSNLTLTMAVVGPVRSLKQLCTVCLS